MNVNRKVLWNDCLCPRRWPPVRRVSSLASVRRSSPSDAVPCHPCTTAPRQASASLAVTLSNAVGLATFSMQAFPQFVQLRRSSPADAVPCHPCTTAPRQASASVAVTLSNAVGLTTFSMQAFPQFVQLRRSSPADAVPCHPCTTAPRQASASVTVTLSNAVGLATFSMHALPQFVQLRCLHLILQLRGGMHRRRHPRTFRRDTSAALAKRTPLCTSGLPTVHSVAVTLGSAMSLATLSMQEFPQFVQLD